MHARTTSSAAGSVTSKRQKVAAWTIETIALASFAGSSVSRPARLSAPRRERAASRRRGDLRESSQNGRGNRCRNGTGRSRFASVEAADERRARGRRRAVCDANSGEREKRVSIIKTAIRTARNKTRGKGYAHAAAAALQSARSCVVTAAISEVTAEDKAIALACACCFAAGAMGSYDAWRSVMLYDAAAAAALQAATA